MKYIMFRMHLNGPGSVQVEVPIIFPNGLVHEDVCRAIQITHPTFTVVSAGSWNAERGCSGRSETLKLASRMRDTGIIKYNDYGAGIEGGMAVQMLEKLINEEGKR